MEGETRVVLIKPGDTPVIGNVGDFMSAADELQAAVEALRGVGLERVIVFGGDIDMSKVPGHERG